MPTSLFLNHKKPLMLFSRRVIVSSCHDLTYLDQRPVNEKERLSVEAWKEGGIKAERIFREEWAKKEENKIKQNIMAMKK